jgi:hypothetical protein
LETLLLQLKALPSRLAKLLWAIASSDATAAAECSVSVGNVAEAFKSDLLMRAI